MEPFETRTFGDVTLVRGNCLDVMPVLPAHTVNFCFADLPYGITESTKRWDVVIPFKELWLNLGPLASEGCAYVMTATQPFATKLISSNLSQFRYDIIWHKSSVGFLNAKKMPLRAHEHVLVFGKRIKTYNPQKTFGHKNYTQKRLTRRSGGDQIYGKKEHPTTPNDGSRYPTSVKNFHFKDGKRLHPTQKPVALLEWLIRTYTNDGDTILDPVAGSATTAIAAMNVGNRKVICIEKDSTYFEVMTKRVADHQKALADAQA